MRNGCVGCLIIGGLAVAVPTALFTGGFSLLGWIACVIGGCILFKPLDRMIFGKKKENENV